MSVNMQLFGQVRSCTSLQNPGEQSLASMPADQMADYIVTTLKYGMGSKNINKNIQWQAISVFIKVVQQCQWYVNHPMYGKLIPWTMGQILNLMDQGNDLQLTSYIEELYVLSSGLILSDDYSADLEEKIGAFLVESMQKATPFDLLQELQQELGLCENNFMSVKLLIDLAMSLHKTYAAKPQDVLCACLLMAHTLKPQSGFHLGPFAVTDSALNLKTMIETEYNNASNQN